MFSKRQMIISVIRSFADEGNQRVLTRENHVTSCRRTKLQLVQSLFPLYLSHDFLDGTQQGIFSLLLSISLALTIDSSVSMG